MSSYEERAKRTESFCGDRFGMFIHWGLYAIPARGEWIKSVEKISSEEYQQYFDEFDPVHYDPAEWAHVAKEAGMKYAVMTAKHHDGFCLFDSQYTDYKATNTKAGRDLIKEYVDAFRSAGIKVGFYYSLLDWYHPDYPHYGDLAHPMRDNEAYKDYTYNFSNYIEYMHNQARELLTNYGKIDIMWFDFSYDDMTGEKWEAAKLVKMARELQPGIVIDSRLGGCITDAEPAVYAGDFDTPEQLIPTEGIRDRLGRDVPWEACVTLNNNWGYHAFDKNYKTPKAVVRMLAECVSKGGNMLINVGPNAKGDIPKESIEALKLVGEWMRQNGGSIYGCGRAAFEKPEWGRYTQKGNMLYAHIFDRGVYALRFDGLEGKLKKARLLSDGAELKLTRPWNATKHPDDAFIDWFGDLPDDIDTVIELELIGGDNT
jgi:alpha-L-fucosidase